mmetsp:Transcript_11050/g.32022  ORF Transcript_11050/g.32022 Transcript_11050/m.32022 type:complete len:297 (-) Transcript_11050:25-915(-)|eukprot:CAMPEP_0172356922 /NCGR_PEP_ID=MMETSP1060-20121228/1296_1 /TAXON_ID=37318 /ORGANISM="Pseudo-nitzschia pungens, Strain cf. cingulata" /LENGTH=296 /DNA_ID=CAMNT_0013077315 /DNA_START=194 /DNA_END=1084 /DNA_ORIENTATION=-
MIRSPFVASSTRFLVAISVLLLIATSRTRTTPFADASATATKTYASTAPETQRRGNTEYVVSSFRNCNDKDSDSDGNGSIAENEPSQALAFVSEKQRPAPKWKTAYRWYLRSCAEKPFRAKGLTSATIAALGDVIAQQIERRSSSSSSSDKAFSASRVATFFFCNMLFTGPFIHLWYTFLDVVGQQMDRRLQRVTNLKKTVAQVFLDQTLGTFVFFPLYIFVYNVFESVIQLRRLPVMSHATDKCRKLMWGIIKTQYRVFPFSNMINFGLVPLELRVLFTSTVSLFWNIYLCSVVG